MIKMERKTTVSCTEIPAFPRGGTPSQFLSPAAPILPPAMLAMIRLFAVKAYHGCVSNYTDRLGTINSSVIPGPCIFAERVDTFRVSTQ